MGTAALEREIDALSRPDARVFAGRGWRRGPLLGDEADRDRERDYREKERHRKKDRDQDNDRQ